MRPHDKGSTVVVQDLPAVGEFSDDLGRELTWSDRRLKFNIATSTGHRKFRAGSLVEVLTQPNESGEVAIHQRGTFGWALSSDLEPIREVLP